jgi:hypothetical protein
MNYDIVLNDPYPKLPKGGLTVGRRGYINREACREMFHLSKAKKILEAKIKNFDYLLGTYGRAVHCSMS